VFIKIKIDNPELSFKELADKYNEENGTQISKKVQFHIE